MPKSSCPNIIFFYSSPIGKLEIQLKNNHIYSILKADSLRNKAGEKSLNVLNLKEIFPAERSEKRKEFLHKANINPLYVKVQKSKKIMELSRKLMLFLDDYFLENKKRVENFPLYSRGTIFQQKVWKFLRKIPYGQTCSYSQVAEAIGSPGAARAVGSACAKNPWLILTPCHRVVAQKGLGGFALGLPAKILLLNHEKCV